MAVSRKIVAALAMLCVGGFANANLVENGSFENNPVNENSWKWFSSSNVDGWEGSNIEIWNSFGNVEAFDGENFAELNAHPGNGNAFTIYQTISTVANNLYDFSFAYSARKNSSESFMVDVMSGNTSIFSTIIDDHNTGSWSEFVGGFEAISDSTTISFTTVNPESGTVGNFLDAVFVDVADPSTNVVSSPGVFALMSLGVAFIGARRFTK